MPNLKSRVMARNLIPDYFPWRHELYPAGASVSFDPRAGSAAQVRPLRACSRSETSTAFDFSFPYKRKAMMDVQGLLTQCGHCAKSWTLLIEEAHFWLPIWSMNAVAWVPFKSGFHMQ